MSSLPARPRLYRLPRLVLAAWAIAAAVVVAVGVAVAHYLSAGTGGTSGSTGATTMPGMHMGGAETLVRAGGSPLGPLVGSALVTRWQLDALAVVVIVIAAAWYLTGVALVPVRRPGTRWPWARTLAFLGGLGAIGYATNGAIAVYDQVLFTAHMAGHLLLVMVAPALLVAGRPLTLALTVAEGRRRDRIAAVARGRVVSLLTAPPVALACYAAVIVGSHLTGIMDTVMRNAWAGQLEHLVYLVVGCQFFVLVVGDEPVRWRLAAPARWLLLAVAMAVDTFTGIVLLQGTRVVAMVVSPRVSVNPLSDTRTGGAIMWFGGDAVMAAIMIALVIGWLRSADTSTAQDERGWLEQARRATFTDNTGAETATALDADEAARESYNAWLAQLSRDR